MQSLRHKTKLLLLLSATVVSLIGGCSGNKKATKEEKAQKEALLKKIELNQTIGSYAEVFSFGETPVMGYGLVAGLNGSGSSECSAEIRNYLVKYIQKQIDARSLNEAERVILSNNTAAVKVLGLIPTGARTNQTFDVIVEPLDRTQTTSLHGGRLYTTELALNPLIGGTTILAEAKGSIYIDMLESETPKARIIGGAKFIQTTMVTLSLNEESYQLAHIIRNRIDERFGPRTANPKNAGLLIIDIPDKYKNNPAKFVQLILALYIPENDQSRNERIIALAQSMGNEEINSFDSEISLEAIGRPAINSLIPLSKSENELIRFKASRCLLNITNSNDYAMILKKIAHDKNSEYRIMAIEAIGQSARRNTVMLCLNSLLSSDDLNVRIAAYNQLSKIDAISIDRQVVADHFMVNTVTTTGENIIYVRRQNVPEIIMLGTNIKCNEGLFASSKDGQITLNSTIGSDKISIIRKNPKKPGIVKIYSEFDLYKLIQRLAEQPDNPNGIKGVAIPLDTIIELIKQMCDAGLINAKFQAGPLSDDEI